jgi:hypothetical protein
MLEWLGDSSKIIDQGVFVIMKCTSCGSTSLVEGVLSDCDRVKFTLTSPTTPKDTPMLRKIFGVGGRSVRAYGCTHCGHLQLAVDFRESDFDRYQNFEGEMQRSAVEQEMEKSE